ncbi:TetR/AcrR family transcriptional regulator [Saccharothrix sp. NPDC042600]|uniref:TetR/AcrR family transcriptional regulator n=1 Tax=Saccharothrix sp. NPDC042600 TaxID=3154492 RepID=UPI0033C96050
MVRLPSDDARQRSGETKRARSRAALLAAAADVFRRGWHEARIEDIAKTAGVSPATAYNHFPGGKQELIGRVYAPFIDPLAEAAEADVDAGRDPIEAVEDHIRAAVMVMRRELPLTIALTAAVTEQVVKVGRPPVPDPNDVRMLARWTTSLTLLVAYGQDQGVFREFPAAQDVSSYHILSLLQRIISRREETVEETVAIALSQLLPPLLIAQRETAKQLPTASP